MNNKPRIITIGRIGTSHGVHGWLRLHSYTDPRENIFNYHPLLIQRNNDWQEIEIVESKTQGQHLLVLLPDSPHREAARLYTNLAIGIPRENLPELSGDEYYWSDLEGLTVINQEGQTLGSIDYLVETASNDVMVLKSERGTHAVPYHREEVVLNINLKEKTMLVNWEPIF